MAIAQSVGEPRRTTARPTTRTPLSKPRRARLILSATTATILFVLAGWLLLAPWMGRTRSESPVLAATFDDAQTQRPEAITAGVGGRVLADVLGARLVAPSALPGARDALAGRGGLAVIYLGGVGLLGNEPGARDEGRPWIIAGDAHDPAQRVALDDLIDQLDTKAAPPTLLILDLVPVASDRDLSLYGNGVLARLQEHLKSRRDGRVVVLASCAEGQQSWMNEAERRSVFAHYVAEGLAGGAAGWDGTVTVRGLKDYVAPRVASWVSAHRGAVQTPAVMGNLDLLDGPPLPRIRPRARASEAAERAGQAAMTADAPDAAAGKADDLGGDVVAAWKRRDAIARQWAEREGRLRNRALAVAGGGRGDAPNALAAGTPALADPLVWRAYEAALLRAEARSRAGDEPNARIALDEATRLADEVERLIGELPHPEALSVAMLERNLAAKSAATKAETAEPAAYLDMVDKVLNAERLGSSGSSPATPAAAADAAAQPPQAPSDAAPKADATPKADAPPAQPQRAGPPTIADLTTDPLRNTPLYAEGRLAVWYHRFVQRRGESEMARADRLRLLGFGDGVLRLAEQGAAADPAVHRWLRARLDEADARRREGQDILFAADPADIARAKPALDAAEVAYRDVSREALACLEIHFLLRRLQDELPAYAEAVARLGDSDNEAFLGLIASAADLADLVDDPTVPDAATLIKRCDERDLRAGLGRRLAAFVSGFEARAATLAARAGPSDWRQVDALLRCPRLPAETRQQLLAKAGAPELSPSLEGGTARAAAEPNADPSVLREARNLARIEAHLLRLAGADRTECADMAAPLESGEPRIETLDRFAHRAYAMRRRLLDGRLGRITESASAPEKAREDLAAADRAARVAPTGDALRMRRGGDPARLLLAYDRLDQLRWYARRLDEELASREATSVAQAVLGDHGRRWFRDLDELERLIKERLVAQIRIEPDGAAGVRLVMDSALPVGQAALLGGPLIAIPGGAGRREVAVPAGTAEDAVFFRGRVFPEAAPPPPEALRLVDVRLREVRTEGRVPITVIRPSGSVQRRGSVNFEWQDQFEVHPDRIYVQKNHPLHYKLILENRRKDRPLTLHVSYGLSSRRPMTRTVTIPPGGVDESLEGKVFVDDLPADKPDAPAGPDTLVVQVRRGGALGELVAEPASVEVSRIHPRSYIDATIGYAPDALGQVVVVTVKHHGGTMLAPAFVEVGFQPPAFRQLDYSKTLNPCNIRAGDSVEFRFLVVQAPEKFKWTVTADHETVRSQEEVFGVPGAAPPESDGKPPGSGKPDQGGAPPQGPASAGGPG